MLAATQRSSDKTETGCRVLGISKPTRLTPPCGWQSCKNPWTAERAAYTVMGYCTTSSIAPPFDVFLHLRTSMSCHSVCPLLPNVARQTRCAPRVVAVSALRSVANPTQICQLSWLLIQARFPHGRQPSLIHAPQNGPRSRYRPTGFRTNDDFGQEQKHTNDALICNKRASV